MINKRVGDLNRKLRHRPALRFAEVDRCLAALGAELEIRGLYRGAAADRLLDERHAEIVARVVGILRKLGSRGDAPHV